MTTLAGGQTAGPIARQSLKTPFTFVALGEVPFDEWRRKRGRFRAIAEVAVEYAVPDVADFASGVYRVSDGRWTSIR